MRLAGGRVSASILLSCVCSGRPDIGRSRGSLDSEEKPLESSESDSLGEYENPEMSKFNEDGSFIGLYGGSKKQPSGAPQSASSGGYNTFV